MHRLMRLAMLVLFFGSVVVINGALLARINTAKAYHQSNPLKKVVQPVNNHLFDPVLPPTPNWTVVGELYSGAMLGFSVAGAGDINGDGFREVIVGSRDYSGGYGREGRADVYYGSSAGLSLTSGWNSKGGASYAYLGSSVDCAGDVNGDGYADVIIGAPLFNNGSFYGGRVFVYSGSETGLNDTPDWFFDGDIDSDYFGFSVSTAGDVNGDGYDDVIIGAKGYSNGQNEEGRAYIFLGSASGLSQTPVWITESDQAQTGFGYSVSTAGDVNSDGYDDVIVGSFYYIYGAKNHGNGFVYLGSADGVATSPVVILDSGVSMDSFGTAVSNAGDVNGDGFADVIVGAPAGDNTQLKGRSYVYYGMANGISEIPAWIAESTATSSGFGVAVASAGDVNNDGYSDVIVGAPNSGSRRVYVFLGSDDGLSPVADWTVVSSVANSSFGSAVDSAGDVNGDSYSDVIIGAPMDNSRGAAFVYHGAASDEPTVTQTKTSTPAENVTETSVPTDTKTETPTPSEVETGTETLTPTPTGIESGTETMTPTPSETPTPTGFAITYTTTPSSTRTPTSTHTETPTVTMTAISTRTSTWTSTHTRTSTSTETPTVTNTSTPTNTETVTLTNTNTPTVTRTNTATQTGTSSPTVTSTRLPTRTNTSTPTSTPTPEIEPIEVPNGGFESGTYRSANWWRKNAWFGNPSFARVSSVKYEGDYSVRIHAAKYAIGGWNKSGNQMISITGGRTYTINAFIKTLDVNSSRGSGALLAVQFFNGSGSPTDTLGVSDPLTGTNDWSEISIMLTAPDNAEKLRISLILNGTGTVWFDEVSIIQND
jgi:hypothetical protein